MNAFVGGGSGEEEPAPLVIVEGFLCAASSLIWGTFDEPLSQGSQYRQRSSASYSQTKHSEEATATNGRQQPRRVVFAPIGPVSSIHDRACELFYGLQGGRVDYGEAHSRAHGHGRYGKTFGKPLLPGWGNDFALRSGDDSSSSSAGQARRGAHFMGHSLGGLTIVKLYELLSAGFFDEALGITSDSRKSEDATSPSPASFLMLSLTTVSSPHRGTPLVYSLGSIPGKDPQVRFLSPGDCLAKLVHVISWARRLPMLGLDAWLPDFFAEAWAFASSKDENEKENEKENERSKRWQLQEWMGIGKLLAQLWKSDWAEGRDCAPWDCTFEERSRREEEAGEGAIWGLQGRQLGQLHGQKVWLRSYAASVTAPKSSEMDRQEQTPLAGLLSPLAFTARLLRHFDYGNAPPPPLRKKNYRSLRGGSDSGYCSSAEDDAEDKNGTMHASDEEKVRRDWQANDGVVPFASQFHPSDCMRGHCQHEAWVPHAGMPDEGTDTRTLARYAVDSAAASSLSLLGFNSKSGIGSPQLRPKPPGSDLADGPAPLPKPNLWHVCELEGTTHASLVPFWTGSEKQRAFWFDLGAWLHDVEMAQSDRVIPL
ncbi:alpha/beta-hydrolase [Acaromyces ingoldii]|uniref:Alpha/beta-hydrolase n=1 Tax=Acaromyces ingoldii TaxID=215250 RepID=A0A316YNS5_9BASI|nr:alpha/beta-hydrolase [Acaromyces ingoldii]PWN90454.1 alpha/beta-hydrolase [Acaromyces ingoldii]